MILESWLNTHADIGEDDLQPPAEMATNATRRLGGHPGCAGDSLRPCGYIDA